jgi:hypothetical protein
LQWIRCGKRACRSCPHGPYWYAFWWDADRQRMRSGYVGKFLPREETREQEREQRREGHVEVGDPFDFLGITRSTTRDEATRAYKRRMVRVHPDKGGTHTEAVAVNLAWERVKRYHRWA